MEVKKISKKNYIYQLLQGENIDPPVERLYSLGEIPDLSDAVAIVGSRRISEYGKRVCREFARALVAAGIPIISGLMYGVDIEAHHSAINNGGKTVAVLGYGHNYIKNYGYAHTLTKEILQNKSGAIISEYEPYVPAAKWTFPKRNRIIAALSKAVLVVEAGEKSGSLITAGYAAEQGKEVFVIPGSIYSQNSKGTNWLIKQGAQIATSPEDILMFLNKGPHNYKNSRAGLNKAEIDLLEQIETLDKHATLQKLVELVKVPAAQLNADISRLELKGFIAKDMAGNLAVLK